NARRFSDKDSLFYYSCLDNYMRVSGIYSSPTALYVDWVKNGNSDPNFAVIPWKLSSTAKIGLIGDWGTGLNDAKMLLKTMVSSHNPDCIIHLGDVYYSGTIQECQANMNDLVNQVYTELGKPRVPFFTIPGNHEYYSYGEGFFDSIKTLNSGVANNTANQVASYFCLRSSDNKWQFLAMDTGQDDYSPYNAVNTFASAPTLQASEKLWLKKQIDDFPGQTILLSHHQLYSAHDKLNGSGSWGTKDVYVNDDLLKTFQPYFFTKVAAWFWGHEHNAAFLRPRYLGLNRGCLFGASAYEQIVGSGSDDIYYINNNNVAYVPGNASSNPPKLGTSSKTYTGDNYKYYKHAFGILTLSSTRVTANYYQVESYGHGHTESSNLSTSTLYNDTIYPTKGGLNPKDFLPVGSKQGNNGHWHSPDWGDNDMNRNSADSDKPLINTLSDTEFKVSGSYKFYYFHINSHSGTMLVHINHLDDASQTTVHLELTGDWFGGTKKIPDERASFVISPDDRQCIIFTGLGTVKYTLQMRRQLFLTSTSGNVAIYNWRIAWLYKPENGSSIEWSFQDSTIPSVVVSTGAGSY
ncbi:MAG TPA: metallophosphoesterase, partial [Bacteroidia bacterium]|nr:metallophosphoesterase [Bacteroidia bacterium]